MFADADLHSCIDRWKVSCSANNIISGGSPLLRVMEAKMSQSSSGGTGWQLEGNAPLAYDTHIVDVFLQDYSRRLVEVATIKPDDRVLDVACGTGVVTRLVANKIGSAGQVVGFDLNAGMLVRARASAPAIE